MMKIRWVQKNNGDIEKVDSQKLASSVLFAIRHAKEERGEVLRSPSKDERAQAIRVAQGATAMLEGKNKEVVSSVEVRDAVLELLKKEGGSGLTAAYELESLHLGDIPVKEVLKWSGKKEEFHPYKLFKSVRRACTGCGILSGKIAENITRETIKNLSRLQKNGVIPVHAIKRETAHVLKKMGLSAIEKSYTLHRYL